MSGFPLHALHLGLGHTKEQVPSEIPRMTVRRCHGGHRGGIRLHAGQEATTRRPAREDLGSNESREEFEDEHRALATALLFDGGL